MKTNVLFQPLALSSGLTLKNRIVMAPMTRSSADDALVPTRAMAKYYAKRASAGLIITEAILVAKDGQGYPNSPGLYNQAQIEGWREVTNAVHQQGGHIFAQIWHTGRLSHSFYRNGQPPIAPSAVAWRGRLPQTEDLFYDQETPVAMSQAEINRIITAFAKTAANAKEAGFDGIEIHGANGYLIDQFLHHSSNQRSDQYGGSAENMCRFLFEILEAIQQCVDGFPIALRLSPHSGEDEAWQVMDYDAVDAKVMSHLLRRLNDYDLAYIHNGMYDDCYLEVLGASPSEFIRQYYRGTVLACGGYDQNKAESALADHKVELIAFGRPFLANPDLVERFKTGAEIKPFAPDSLKILE